MEALLLLTGIWKFIAGDLCGFYPALCHSAWEGLCCGCCLTLFITMTWSCYVYGYRKVSYFQFELVYLFLSCVGMYTCGVH